MGTAAHLLAYPPIHQLTVPCFACPTAALPRSHQPPPPHTHTAVEISFKEQEALVWEQLSGLVRDAAWLKSYLVGALLLLKEMMQATLLALGPTKQPLPGFGAARTGALHIAEYGAVGDNTQVVSQMAQVGDDWAGGLGPGESCGCVVVLLWHGSLACDSMLPFAVPACV